MHLVIDAHGAISGEGGSVWAYDVDASRGVRGRVALSSLDAAARRYDHARLGVGSSGPSLMAVGLQADGIRGDWLDEPASVGPFASWRRATHSAVRGATRSNLRLVPGCGPDSFAVQATKREASSEVRWNRR